MSESLNTDDFDRLFTPEEIQSIFEKAKKAKRDENGYFLEGGLNITSAIAQAGKQKYYQFEQEIWPYLKHQNEFIVTEAIIALGSRLGLHLPHFREVAYDIWNNYKEESEFSDVRRTALSAWCSYYQLSNDKEALTILYKVLTTHPVVDMRTTAYRGIFTTCNAFKSPAEMTEISRLSRKRSHEHVNQKVDWERVHKLMKQYAPDVELVDLSKLPKDS